MVTPSKPKVAKQDTAQEDTIQPSEDTTSIDIDSDSLPDPFAPKEMTPKMSGTKEDQSAENIQEGMELISDDDNDAPPKSFSTKDPTGIPKTSHHHPKKFTTKKPPPQPCCKLISLYPKLLSILFPKLNFSLFYP